MQGKKLKHVLLSSTAFFSLIFSTNVESLELKDALVHTYNTNPSLEASRAQLRANDENVPQALSNWYPSVTFSGNLRHTISKQKFKGFDNPSNPLDDTGPTLNTTSADLTLALSQNIYRGGRTVAATESAKQNVYSLRQGLLTTEQQVLLNAITAYSDVYRDEKILEYRRESQDILERQLEASQDRFDVGEITRTDVAQAESRLAAAKANTATAIGNYETSKATFKQVVGLDAKDIKEPELFLTLPKKLEESLAKAQSHNPSIFSASHAYRASVAQVRNNIGNLLPTLVFQIQLQRDYNYLNDSARDNRAFRSPQYYTDSAVGTLSLTVPILGNADGTVSGGGQYAAIRAAKQNALNQNEQVKQAYRQVIQNTQQAWQFLRASEERIKYLEIQVKAAKIAFEGAEQEALVGARTVLDVLDTEQELINARLNLAAAKRDYIVAGYQLFQAIGFLTAKDLKLDVKLYDVQKYYDEVKHKVFGIGEDIPIYPYALP